MSLHKPRFSPHLSSLAPRSRYCSRLALGWGIPLAWKRVCGYWIAAGTLLHLTVARLAQRCFDLDSRGSMLPQIDARHPVSKEAVCINPSALRLSGDVSFRGRESSSSRNHSREVAFPHSYCVILPQPLSEVRSRTIRSAKKGGMS